ncbi:hypothetical protein [Microcystis phage MJing1]|nr:hypothetical protein [Microcystis phage MJing1]
MTEKTTTSPELLALLEQARSHRMTPDEIRAQRRSYVAGEMAMGSDADEAAYRAALAAGDAAEVARLNAEAEARRRAALASELRAWLMTYSGLSVSRRDAENLRDFLIKSGWTAPR